MLFAKQGKGMVSFAVSLARIAPAWLMRRRPEESGVARIEDGATFDYVIVGAGSAGCVLASRLSEDVRASVALLEAGPADNSVIVRMPAGSGQMLPQKNPRNWGFESEPQAQLGGRTTYQPRGRGLGGSSSINGMIYIRGHGRDYDQWCQMGLTGWGFRDVLPYFRRSENNERFADDFHGRGGPLTISSPPRGNPLFHAFIQAGMAAGYPYTQDFNGAQQEGVGLYQMTIANYKRASTARAFLHPAVAGGAKISVVTGAQATGILFENKSAVGVRYASGRGAPEKKIYASREVILSAGAFQSPHLLLLSGVGPAAHLQERGVAVVHDARDVGRNLQDHLDLGLVWDCTKPITVYSQTKGYRQLLVGLRYMISKEGPGRTNHLEAGGFIRTRGELDRPDVQLHFFDANFYDHARVRPDRDGFAVHACLLRPESKGEVRLASSDPFDDPAIDPNYLASEVDKRTLRDSVRIVRTIVNQRPMDLSRGAELRPGDKIVSDADIDAWVRETAETIYHPVGTCRMGVDDHAVVDESLRTRGVRNLRVVDASVMPTLIGGNTNAPTIMVAEKAADMMLGKAALAPMDAELVD
jgi:choline dehydrogenase